MEKQAIAKYLRISAFKARQVTRLIQDRPVVEAIAMLKFMPRKAARLVEKVLHSAVANIESNPDQIVDRKEMYVKEATVGESTTQKRFRPKARGSAGRIRKRRSHIKVIVATSRE